MVAELEGTSSINSSQVSAAIDTGVVTLFREVDSYSGLCLATKAAELVHGVTALAQEITVQSKWTAINDTDIARQAADAVLRVVDVRDSVRGLQLGRS